VFATHQLSVVAPKETGVHEIKFGVTHLVNLLLCLCYLFHILDVSLFQVYDELCMPLVYLERICIALIW
jgi:hypothetical protein